LLGTQPLQAQSHFGRMDYAVHPGHVKNTMEVRKRLNQVGFNWEHCNNRFEREWMEQLDGRMDGTIRWND